MHELHLRDWDLPRCSVVISHTRNRGSGKGFYFCAAVARSLQALVQDKTCLSILPGDESVILPQTSLENLI